LYPADIVWPSEQLAFSRRLILPFTHEILRHAIFRDGEEALP